MDGARQSIETGRFANNQLPAARALLDCRHVPERHAVPVRSGATTSQYRIERRKFPMSQTMKQFTLASLLVCAASGAAFAADSRAGGALFQEKCSVCHGADGVAKLPGAPSFAKGERLEKADDALKRTVLSGLNAMPPFRGTLSDAQIGDLLAFVRTLRK
jgi:mono/diheme cytochrome c family protein